MYVLTNCQTSVLQYLSYLPPALSVAAAKAGQDGLCEIRLRRARPVMLYYTDGCYYLDSEGGRTKDLRRAYIVSSQEMTRACEMVFEFSLYAHQDELSEGYVTIRGGHRIGIAGGINSGKIRSLSDITSLNYRIAHEHIGIADPIMPKIIREKRLMNTIIVSPPMCGKTSLLRDIVRASSQQGIRVGVCDTRKEIAAVYDGEPEMDIGNADVVSGAPKSSGMMMLLRCMSPDAIVCDELGAPQDARAAERIFGCGVSLIATAHAGSRKEFFDRPEMSAIAGKFDCVITLGGIGEVREVYYV